MISWTAYGSVFPGHLITAMLLEDTALDLISGQRPLEDIGGFEWLWLTILVIVNLFLINEVWKFSFRKGHPRLAIIWVDLVPITICFALGMAGFYQ